MLDIVSTIGLLASADQLAIAAVTILTNLNTYYQHVRNADARAADLRKELLSLADTLNDSSDLFERNTALLECNTIANVFEEIRTLLNELLERTTPKETKGFRKLLWPFKEKENGEILFKIERFKSKLSLSLDIMHG